MIPLIESRCNETLKIFEKKYLSEELEESEQPWQTLGQLVRLLKNSNAEFWWHASGPILGTLMKEADYDLQSQFTCLIFHLYNILPRLGPTNMAPTKHQWKSFMCDDFSPLEYSWNWNSQKSGPKIRYSVELSSARAGSSFDPYNREPTIELCTQLRRDMPKADWALFDLMQHAFYDSSIVKDSEPKESGNSSSSSLFLAFELGKHIATKAYFMPTRADQHGISRMDVLNQAIQMLRKRGYPCSGYEKLLRFITTKQRSMLEIVIVAIDCFESEESRFKIYMRSPRTSFASVCETMTLGSTVDVLTEDARTNLKDLWQLTLGLDPCFSEDADLPVKTHQTAGVLYNFDIKLRGSSVQPKLYIPVKHYAANDASAAIGLGKYLQSRGQDAYFPNYMRALERTCTHRDLNMDSGYQTYIGTGVQKDDSLALCSYINGEVYHPNRLCN
ncbi:tryptophan dimethylallyltransferase-domain-containing protein [Ampelomyces quisqualis]|uniref:Tryptophan dimethylallyltransferase-domain-containing protein n=1 Tax=Ampelomyces quisqualis TaxID=50730 RepID=A0A6A5QAF4_AMPQU|nr:tryptophan dimethylallyltransferase-domain-containing protein [Ampelomyces quisqualis]